MKKRKLFVVILAVAAACIGCAVGVRGLYVSRLNQGIEDIDTSWQCGYAGPRQYYQENLSRITEKEAEVDGIKYRFDDLGRAEQRENTGEWSSDSKGQMYVLQNSVKLENIWYEIDGKWYYFAEDGYVVCDRFLREDGYLFYVDENGALATENFTINNNKYEPNSQGILYHEKERTIDEIGNTIQKNGVVVENADPLTEYLCGDPWICYNDINYKRDVPVYFYKNDYTYAKRVSYEEACGESPIAYLFEEGDIIFTKENDSDHIYVLRESEKSFYSYSRW